MNLKYLLFLIILSGIGQISYSQINPSWSENELEQANTVENSSYLNEVEKEAVVLLNLARMFPKRFVVLELEDYEGPKKYGSYLKNSSYKSSLIKAMNSMNALPALQPDASLTDNARCFAIESGKSGYMGHERKTCEDKNYAECCSYGMETAKDIVMQLIIDHDVPSLGHRSICFSTRYKTIGIAIAPHAKWDSCCVLELI